MDEFLIWNALVGALVETVEMHKEAVHGTDFEWPEALLLRATDGKRYRLDCSSDCLEDGYGDRCTASFGIEEIEK